MHCAWSGVSIGEHGVDADLIRKAIYWISGPALRAEWKPLKSPPSHSYRTFIYHSTLVILSVGWAGAPQEKTLHRRV
eukprot:5676554-Amphidinium_carterae.1